MEVYITRSELDHVLKKLKKLEGFLTDTFGSKFTDFNCGKEDISLALNESSLVERNQSNIIIPTNKDSSPNVNDPFYTETSSMISMQSKVPPPTLKNNEKNTITVGSDGKVYLVAKSMAQNTHIVKPSLPLNTCLRQEPEKHESQKKLGAEAAAPLTTGFQPYSAKQTKGIVPITTQLEGSLFHKKATSPSISRCTNDDKSCNDSVPIPVVDTEYSEGTTSPHKRSRPSPLPSFRKQRTLGLQSTLQQPEKAVVSSTTTTASAGESEIIQCDLCNLFIYSSQLDNHMKNHSLLDGKSAEKLNPLMKKNQICPICSIVCSDFEMYEKHCAESHRDQGFPCPICSRRMSSKSKLNRHMIIHKNLKFECKICGKTYNRSDNLTAHYKTHKNDEQVAIFYCPMCNMAFSSRSGRDKHTKTAHLENQTLSDNDSPGNDEEDEDNYSYNQSDFNVIIAAETERIKVEDSADFMGIEFEYEGDEDDL